MLQILLADDEPAIRLALGDSLRDRGHQVALAADGREALDQLQSRAFDLLVTDVRMPRLDGAHLFAQARELHPDLDVILMTAYGQVSDAVEAMKNGARDYLIKPFDPSELALRVAHVDERRTLVRELDSARRSLAAASPSDVIVGRSPQMHQLATRIQTVARTDTPIIVTGESGTGKELVARSLHALSPRADKPFVVVNCAAFPESLLEAELFGHAKGAFTGALKERKGRFQAADGGTLFLDEVGEIPMLAQVKLLRVLQDSTIEPLGTNDTVKVDVRVVSATHRDLKRRMAEGLFREDLYYRLNVLNLHVPPLRERRGDLPLLVEHFLQRFAGGPVPISPRAWAALSSHSFPGNVRELEHAIRHAVVLSAGVPIELQHLPPDVTGAVASTSEQGPEVQSLSEAMHAFERAYLVRALNQAEGVRHRAAELLGISRKNLWEKLRAHGITESEVNE